MTNSEAYGDITYEQRLARRYSVGERVTIGPAYQGQDQYAFDDACGEAEILKEFPNGEYLLWSIGTSSEVYLYASRIMPSVR